MSGTTPAGSLDALDASDAYRRANEPAELVAMIGTSLTPEADGGPKNWVTAERPTSAGTAERLLPSWCDFRSKRV